MAFFIESQFFDRHGIETLIKRHQLCIGLSNLGVVLRLRRPAQTALVSTQSWVEPQIAQAKNNGDDKHTHPPGGQGVVHLSQVLVPDMACGVVGVPCVFLASRHPQQHQARQYANDADDRDIARPK